MSPVLAGEVVYRVFSSVHSLVTYFTLINCRKIFLYINEEAGDNINVLSLVKCLQNVQTHEAQTEAISVCITFSWRQSVCACV